jgi:hypothetical protein
MTTQPTEAQRRWLRIFRGGPHGVLWHEDEDFVACCEAGWIEYDRYIMEADVDLYRLTPAGRAVLEKEQ